MAATLVWFRRDLRLQDNPALAAALRRGGPIIPVFIHDERGEGDWPLGAASRWWLHHSLVALDGALRERRSRLVVASGDSAEVLRGLIRQTQATAVYWNRRYEPVVRARDASIKTGLLASGLEAKSFNSALLFEPHTIENKSGGPFQVFTPFWRHCLAQPVETAGRLSTAVLPAPARWPESPEIADLQLLPRHRWGAGLRAVWTPGEATGQQRLKKFIARNMAGYDTGRDFPAHDGTSGLSPHLSFGELGPRQIWAAIQSLSRANGVFPPHRGAQQFLTELGWREFAYHVLYHFPRTPVEPLRAGFGDFPWQRDARQLRAWQRGRTGYPIVDAGMRQLWQTGWMHNRVRMIVASFLVKHLRISWQEGAAWFWDTLVDADLANNTLGWQWSAGCGADAAPYFRIFNPTLQGRKFDADGAYVRRWVPELVDVPTELIHEPWRMAATKQLGGPVSSADYPPPIVEHGVAREAALAAFRAVRRN